MSTTTHPGDRPVADPGQEPGRDLAQLGLAAVTAVVGAYTIYDATTLQVGFADPVGPRVFPYVVGAGLLVSSVLLALAALRGDRPEAEGGEDVDLDVKADWVTVAKLVAIIALTIVTVGFLGWAISGAILFAGSTWALGSRTLIRDVIVGCVLSVLSWYAFYVGLGIPLSAGILDGIL